MKKYLTLTFLLTFPFFVFAQEAKTFQQIVSELIVTGSNYILRLLVALTLFVFLYGLMKYMYKGQESDAARSEGRKLMLWGIIGLFVMTSVWALVALLSNLIGHDKTTIPQFRESTESEIAPNGRFGSQNGAPGAPITQEQYNAGQQGRRAIGDTAKRVGQNASNLLDRAKSAAGSAGTSLNNWLGSVNDYFGQGN